MILGKDLTKENRRNKLKENKRWVKKSPAALWAILLLDELILL